MKTIKIKWLDGTIRNASRDQIETAEHLERMRQWPMPSDSYAKHYSPLKVPWTFKEPETLP